MAEDPRAAARSLRRRAFLGAAMAATGGPLLGHPRGGLAQPDHRAAARRLLERHPAFDMHAHPGLFFTGGLTEATGPLRYAGDEAVADTVGDMVAGQLAGGFFALVSDVKILQLVSTGVEVTRRFDPGEAWADYERQISTFRRVLETVPATLATRVADIKAARARGQVAAFLACEGGGLLEARVERLERLYADGVRSIQLVHYAQNELGDLQTEEPVFGGLSPAGKDVVREMNRLGMAIDVAHASFATVEDAANVSSMPLLLSHSQLAHGKWRHPRLLTPDHARLVADTGGVIGMWPSGLGNETFEDFVDNTLRLIDVVGVDHVGLGTDMDGNYRPVFDSYRQLPDWTAALIGKGLSEAEVARLVGGNAIRVLHRVLS